MSAKVVWYRGSWWVRTHWAGTKKKERKIGPTKADRRAADGIARQINAALALGTLEPDPKPERALPFDVYLREIREADLLDSIRARLGGRGLRA
jgi:hypothetical protein